MEVPFCGSACFVTILRACDFAASVALLTGRSSVSGIQHLSDDLLIGRYLLHIELLCCKQVIFIKVLPNFP